MATFFKPTKAKIFLSIVLFLLFGYAFVTSVTSFHEAPSYFGLIKTLSSIVNFGLFFIISMAEKVNSEILAILLYVIAFVDVILWPYLVSCILVAIYHSIKK